VDPHRARKAPRGRAGAFGPASVFGRGASFGGNSSDSEEYMRFLQILFLKHKYAYF
jgi:hypothetical protein